MNKNKIIIIYADLNLNIIDGSTIWLSNIINTLNNENKTVYFLIILINYFDRKSFQHLKSHWGQMFF